jgi:hypothetical protein
MQVGTYSDGRPLNYDETASAFDVGGTPVTIADVVGYDQAEQVSWLTEDLREWAQGLAGDLREQERATAAAPGNPVTEAKRGRLFGFRSRRIWKMVVASAYYAFCGLAAVAVFASVKPYATDTRDVVLDVVSYLIFVLVLLSPAFLLSDFGYRNRLPIFKRRKFWWSAAGLAVVCLLLLGTSAFADSLHTQPYKVAAERERVALQKKQEAEAAAKKVAEASAAAEAQRVADAKKTAEASAAAEARRVADAKKSAEASVAAETKRVADAKKSAQASATAAAAASAAASEKKLVQQAYLSFETKFYDTEKPAADAIATFQNCAALAAQNKTDALTLYGSIRAAKSACSDAEYNYSGVETPARLPQDVKDMLDKAKEDIEVAYMLKSEAFGSMASYMDSQKLSDLQDFKDKMSEADANTTQAAVQLVEARDKLGLLAAK